VLDALATDGLQDDARFAESYVHSRGGRGYGPRRIATELRARGLDATVIERALAVCDWVAQARAAQHKKFGSAPANRAERARQARFLDYRGFDAAQIRQALSTDDEDF
jgi:regulatory protein